ncbi:type I restriction endonuclease [Parabacteroides sp.]|uniref:type I restriction endonuclease n=1 Tax=Parabacteroides sp. TaxID=1869337 RepID=UPI001E16F991|nr:type I restriction endonuclease [Parabacteroides sp.]MBS5485518.1 type I restriction enzyme HsdR N-terminal domain-containing protein [Parabacteroides sp.]
MDFKDAIKQLSERVLKLKDNILTEEATKNAFIMPFINVLGYDVFNPLEVVPEMTCDIAMKKGEKIDYAIIKEGEPILLIECKHWAQDLNLHDNQLIRYFNVSKAKFGILTNGITYRFYTDLIEPNKMDEKPFLEVDITDLKDNQIEELKKFHKSYFDVDNVLSSANELKYTGELKAILAKEFVTPSPDFVKYFAKQVYDGIITAKLLEQFTSLTKKSISTYINDLISERLKSALNTEETVSSQEKSVPSNVEQATEDGNDNKIITTEEEIESYIIVKSILRPFIDISRVVYRDAQTYFAVLLDDNNRKPICRMYFNGLTKKYIATFDENKKETKHEIKCLDDIFNYSQQLKDIISFYDKK